MKKYLSSVFVIAIGFSGPAIADNHDWDSLLEASYEYSNAQQELLEEEFGLSKHERWDFYQDTGLLVFSTNGKPAVVAEIQFIGSFSTSRNTWLWGWANPNFDEKLTSSIQAVRRLGEKQGFEKLHESKWAAEEVDGWEMSAVTNYILKGKGVYRGPSNDLYVFMLLTDIDWVQ